MAKKSKNTIQDTDSTKNAGCEEEIISSATVTDGEPAPSKLKMGILPLRDIVVFPFIPVPVLLSRDSSIALAKKAYKDKADIFCVMQLNPEEDNPQKDDLYKIGVVCNVVNILELPDGKFNAIIVGSEVGLLNKITRKSPYLTGEIRILYDYEYIPNQSDFETSQLLNVVDDLFNRILDLVGEEETQGFRLNQQQFKDEPEKNLSFLSINSPLDPFERQELLEQRGIKDRVELFLRLLTLAYEKMQLKASIQSRVSSRLTDEQREHFLRQQLSLIKDQLGENDSSSYSKLEEKIAKKQLPDEIREYVMEELKKMAQYNTMSPEYGVQYQYIDTFASLPWNEYTEDMVDLDNAQNILDRDHYGLEKVKERITEHLAVIKLRGDKKAPIICFTGPPGVGKTSLGKSIADAMGRKFARVSLGGMEDVSEIRGHRRTYIGAMPGRIIKALIKCGSSNPVLMLDEIDKVGANHRGDPSAALLEVLDPEQNKNFRDNYIDYDYDLSNVMFIATANDVSGLSAPLRDRMEIIDIPGYISEEKFEIARRYLVPKEEDRHGLDPGEIGFDDEALSYIIDSYTRESGVRQLDMKIAEVIRKIAKLKASDKAYPTIITKDEVKNLLGKELIYPEIYENNDYAGVTTGLAWTSVGGEILYIETSLSDGKGKLTLTGNLGDVMKESATIATQYIRSHAASLGIDPARFENTDIHIHVPEGAIPKDGPSAGITIATSLASAFTKRKVRERIAMTGEITLRGKVLPVGGIREKILAAKRAGITDIVLSSQNRRDLEDIQERYLSGLTFHYVERIEDVFNYALLDELAKY